MASTLATTRLDRPADITSWRYATPGHMSGLTYGAFGRSLVKDEYNKAGASPGGPDIDYDNAELVKRVSQLPLAYQPGSTTRRSGSWRFGYSRAGAQRLPAADADRGYSALN